MKPKLMGIAVRTGAVVFTISGEDSTASQFAQFVTGKLGVVPDYGRTSHGDFTFTFKIGQQSGFASRVPDDDCPRCHHPKMVCLCDDESAEEVLEDQLAWAENAIIHGRKGPMPDFTRSH